MIEDLSFIHESVGGLFHQPCDQEEWNNYRLTEEQIEFYHENGYLAGISLLNDQQVESLRAELDELINPAHPGRHLFYEYNSNESADPAKILFHALGAWRVSRGFHDVLWNPAFLVPAAQLLGGAVRFWHDQIFYKPVRHGGVVAWHQDYSYWTRTQPMAHLSCWIGLDDAGTVFSPAIRPRCKPQSGISLQREHPHGNRASKSKGDRDCRRNRLAGNALDTHLRLSGD
jgi:hypothetical protein